MKTISMTQEDIDNNKGGYAFNAESEDGLCVLINGEWYKVEIE
jgi:hypothetical protein